ncbi:MAG: sigma-70 family RNA polymerase sigma factor [Ginsengibacter sp.]
MITAININESDLWENFLKGNDESLEKIYRVYFDDLYAYGNKLFDDKAFSEDVIQDLFVKLIQRRENLSPTTSIKFYLFRSFKSIAFDKLKVSKRYKLTVVEENNSFPVEVNPENQLIEKEDDQEISVKLNAAIQALTPRQREAIFLKYSEGFSYPEITSMLDLTPKATYKLMARAIDALKDHVGIMVQFIFSIKILIANF